VNYVEAISILEIEQYCSIEEVEKSYKGLASKHHPDKGGENDAMARINEARNFLVSHLSVNNLPSVFKQLELSVLNMNQIAQEKRVNEKKVERIEKDIKQSATSKLKSMKNTALVLAAISAGAFFLGKEIPKDLLSGFMPVNIEKPAVVAKPTETAIIKKHLTYKKNIELEKIKSVNTPDYSDKEQKEIDAYLTQSEKYKEYRYASSSYERYKAEVSHYTFLWYIFTFGFGIYAGIGAWVVNRKIHRVESELTDINDDLTIKSSYVQYLKDVFGDKSINEWSLKDLEYQISKNNFKNYSLRLVARNLGAKKLAQLFIAKGQEASFINIQHGTAENDYQEVFTIS